MTSPNTIIADLTEELSQIRNDYENACRLVARMHFAATGSNDGPKIGVVEDVEAIAAEVESLRKQRDEFLYVFGVVIYELETMHGKSGNAPGHGHKVAGVWDSDNGKLAGKPCGWCAVWAKAKDIRNAISSVKGGS